MTVMIKTLLKKTYALVSGVGGEAENQPMAGF